MARIYLHRSVHWRSKFWSICEDQHPIPPIHQRTHGYYFTYLTWKSVFGVYYSTSSAIQTTLIPVIHRITKNIYIPERWFEWFDFWMLVYWRVRNMKRKSLERMLVIRVQADMPCTNGPIPQCTCPISHNTPFRTEMFTHFCFEWCIVGYMGRVNLGICEIGRTRHARQNTRVLITRFYAVPW